MKTKPVSDQALVMGFTPDAAALLGRLDKAAKRRKRATAKVRRAFSNLIGRN